MTVLQRNEYLENVLFNVKGVFRDVRKAFTDFLLADENNYRLYLRHRLKVDKPLGYPKAPWRNAVLKSRQEWEGAVKQVEALGLPLRSDLPKNWDCLAALDCILGKTNSDAYILDAGAELYSVTLPWLYLYGYRHLVGINLVFDKLIKRGPIEYEYGDITHTRFKENTFDAITCLSVIEHGVNLPAFFQEVSRILKPNGIVIISTDYYCDPIDAHGQVAYGVPIHVFSKDEITATLSTAKEYGLELTDNIDLACQEKPIKWDEFGLDYTFSIFTLQKVVSMSL